MAKKQKQPPDNPSRPRGEAEQTFGSSLGDNPELTKLFAELNAAPEEPSTNLDLGEAKKLITELEATIQAEVGAAGDTAESTEATAEAVQDFSLAAIAARALLDSWLADGAGTEDGEEYEDENGEETDETEKPIIPIEPVVPAPDITEAPEKKTATLSTPEEDRPIPVEETAPIPVAETTTQETVPLPPTPESTSEKTETAVPSTEFINPESPLLTSELTPEKLLHILDSLETPSPLVTRKSIVEIFNELNSRRLVAQRTGEDNVATLSAAEKMRAQDEAGFVSVETVKSGLSELPETRLMEILSDPQKEGNAGLLTELIRNYAEASGLDNKETQRIFQQQEKKLRREAQQRLAEGKSLKKEMGKALAKSALYIGGGVGISLATGGLASFFSPLAIGAIRSADIYLTAKKNKKEGGAKLQEIRQELANDESAKGAYLEEFFADLAVAKQLQLGQNQEGSLADCLTANPDILGNISEDEKAGDIRGLEILEKHYNLLNKANTGWLNNHPWANKAIKGLDKVFLAGGSSAGEKTVTSAALFGIGQALRYGGAGAWGRRTVSGLAGAKLGAIGAEYLSGKSGWGEKIDVEKHIIDQEAEADAIFEKFKELKSEKTNLDSKKYKRNAVKTAGVIAGALAGIALGEAASATTHKISSWLQGEAAPVTDAGSASTETAPPAAAKVEQADLMPQKEQLALATIGKGEGIEHALHRQLEANAKELGYAGDLENKSALHHWAGMRAHQIAVAEHYVDPKTGAEVRVSGAGIGHAQYILDDNGHIHEFIDGHQTGESGTIAAKAFEYAYEKPTTPATIISEATPEAGHISEGNVTASLNNLDAKYPGSAELITQATMETTGHANQQELIDVTDYFYHHPNFKPSAGLIELVTSHDPQANRLLGFLEHHQVADNLKMVELINSNDIFADTKNMPNWLEVFLGSTEGRNEGVASSLERIFHNNGLSDHYKSEFHMPDFQVSQTHASAFTGDIAFKTPAPLNSMLTGGKPAMIDWLYDPSKGSFRATINFRGQLIGEAFAPQPGDNNPNRILTRTFESLLDKLKDKVAGK